MLFDVYQNKDFLLIGTNRLLIIMHTDRPAKFKSFIAENNLLQNVMMQLRIFSLRLEKNYYGGILISLQKMSKPISH